MKKYGPQHISIPNEKLVGGSFKSRMRKEKNISKQKILRGAFYSCSHKENHKFIDTESKEIWKRQTVSASAEMPKLPWEPPRGAGSNSTAPRDYQVCCNSIRCEHKCRIPKTSLQDKNPLGSEWRLNKNLWESDPPVALAGLVFI